MTIFFNGNSFKYEMENIVKLFYPLQRFNLRYDETDYPDDEYIVITREKSEDDYRLSVFVKVGEYRKELRETVPADGDDFSQEMACGRMLYRLLHELTDIRPKWGVLTGVRPVKWIQHAMQRGVSVEELHREFIDDFYVDPDKWELALRTAQVQQEILAENRPNDYSLYLSIPYCPSRCSYCSFVSHAITQKKERELLPQYLNTLIDELEATAQLADESGLHLSTIYIGGGTPTVLSAEQLKTVTDAIARFFPVGQAREYTIEAGRADTITREKLEVIRDAGAKRISINPQTFCDSVLEAIGRKHTAKQVEDCYRLARDVGFDAINMDLIAGLPTDTVEGFRYSIDRAVDLSPENITVHTLSVKRSSALFTELRGQELVMPVQQMVDYSGKVLRENGYEPYYLYRQKNTVGNLENVGYSKPGSLGWYNVFIMDEIQTILAAGAGAVSKIVMPHDIHRFYNYKYPYEYITQFSDILDKKKQMKEVLTD